MKKKVKNTIINRLYSIKTGIIKLTNFIFFKRVNELVKLQKRGAASDDLELGIYCQGRGPE